MARQGIGTGTLPNDGTGDTLRAGAAKVNDNFSEIYTYFGDGNNLTFTEGGVGINTVGGSVGTGATILDFRGPGISAVTVNSGIATLLITGGSGSSGVIVQDEGSTLPTTATTLNFVGSAVAASGTGATKTITIAGGGTPYTNSDVDTHLNVGSATTNQILSWTGSDYAWVADQTGGGGSGIDTSDVRTNSLEVYTGVSTFVGYAATFAAQFSGNIFIDAGVYAMFGNTIDKFSIRNTVGKSQLISGQNGGNVEILSQQSGSVIKIGKYSGGANDIALFTVDAGVELFHNTAKKFETLGTGVTVFGTTDTQQIYVSGVSTFIGNVTFGNTVFLGNNDTMNFGNNNDLQLYHTAVHGYVVNNTGNFYLTGGTSGNVTIRTYNKDSLVANLNGSVDLYHNNSKKFETTGYGVSVYGDARVSGILTVGQSSVTINGTTNEVVVGAGVTIQGNTGIVTATEFDSHRLRISKNNATIAGTSGTTGDIKLIGGAPFFYDGTFWREFVLSSGTPVSVPEDTEWDNTIFRNDFDTSLTDQRFGQTIYSGTNNVDLVTSPVKIGTKSARIGYPNNGGLLYSKRSEYDFTGEWTIEGWFYLDGNPTGSGINATPLVFHTYQHDFTFGLAVDYLNGALDFRWWNNQSSTHSYSQNTNGTYLGAYNTGILDGVWCHIALTRNATTGALHLFVNGVESTGTVSNQVVDNDIPAFQNSYELTFGKAKLTSTDTLYMDGFIDDIRISTVERYTSNFTPPTTALPITGTAGTTYVLPGSYQGEVALGTTTATWTGDTGVTASRVAAGQYRITFASNYNNSTDYVINATMNDHVPVTTAIGIGVSRFTTHADLFVNRISDGVGIQSGGLAVDVQKK